MLEKSQKIASPFVDQNLFDPLSVAMNLLDHLQGHIKSPPPFFPSHRWPATFADVVDKIAQLKFQGVLILEMQIC